MRIQPGRARFKLGRAEAIKPPQPNSVSAETEARDKAILKAYEEGRFELRIVPAQQVQSTPPAQPQPPVIVMNASEQQRLNYAADEPVEAELIEPQPVANNNDEPNFFNKVRGRRR
jgi:hypothetical protein